MTQLCRLVMILSLPLIFIGCRDEKSPSSQKDRIEREVERRLVQERKTFEEQGRALRTIRILGFVLLTGGAVGLLYYGQWIRNSRSREPSQNYDAEFRNPTQTNRRVIDLNQPRSRS